MGVLTSEAVVLRTWPVHEADLIVSFFTREYGRMRGVAWLVQAIVDVRLVGCGHRASPGSSQC